MSITGVETTLPSTSTTVASKDTISMTSVTASTIDSDLIAQVTDTYEVSDRLDLTIGSKMLMSYIGQKLQTMFEEHGIDLGEHVNEDMSVDATAERIVEFSTGFFEVWKQQHRNSDRSEDDLLDEFESTIRGAIDDGYGEAIDTLRGMEAMTEGVFTTAEQTYSRIQELLAERFAELRGEDTDISDDGMIEVRDHVSLSVPVYYDFNPGDSASDSDTDTDTDSAAQDNTGTATETSSTNIDVLA